jgi:hypothetical protein
MNQRHGADQVRAVWPPEPGFFRLRLVRKGWAVPCQIICQDGQWQAEVDGVLLPPVAQPEDAGAIGDIWAYGEKITAPVYDWLHKMRRWAAFHDPDHPSLHPRKPINPMTLRPLTPRKATDER